MSSVSLCDYRCPCSVVQSTEPPHYLMVHLHISVGFPNLAAGSVRCGRKQHQAGKVAASAVVFCNKCMNKNQLVNHVGYRGLK